MNENESDTSFFVFSYLSYFFFISTFVYFAFLPIFILFLSSITDRDDERNNITYIRAAFCFKGNENVPVRHRTSSQWMRRTILFYDISFYFAWYTTREDVKYRSTKTIPSSCSSFLLTIQLTLPYISFQRYLRKRSCASRDEAISALFIFLFFFFFAAK